MRNTRPHVLLSFILFGAYGLAAEARQAPPTKMSHAIPSESVPAAKPDQCPAAQHFDPGMGMCMPNAQPNQAVSPASKRTSPKSKPVSAPSAAPHPAPSMNMPMSDDAKSNNGPMVRLNQFMLYSHTSGPRGQSRVTAQACGC